MRSHCENLKIRHKFLFGLLKAEVDQSVSSHRSLLLTVKVKTVVYMCILVVNAKIGQDTPSAFVNCLADFTKCRKVFGNVRFSGKLLTLTKRLRAFDAVETVSVGRWSFAYDALKYFRHGRLIGKACHESQIHHSYVLVVFYDSFYFFDT